MRTRDGAYELAPSGARSGGDFADALIGDTADLYGCTEMVTVDHGAAARLGWRLLG